MLTLATSVSQVPTSHVAVASAVRWFKRVLLLLYVFGLMSSAQRLAAGKAVVLAKKVVSIAMSRTGLLLLLAVFHHKVIFYCSEIQKRLLFYRL